MNKSDYNYIAAVEKAITKKYGKDTVQDFRSDWQQEKEKDYLDQLKVKRIKRQRRATICMKMWAIVDPEKNKRDPEKNKRDPEKNKRDPEKNKRDSEKNKRDPEKQEGSRKNKGKPKNGVYIRI